MIDETPKVSAIFDFSPITVVGDTRIILLLSKEFAILVAIALIIALTFIKPSPANPVEALRELKETPCPTNPALTQKLPYAKSPPKQSDRSAASAAPSPNTSTDLSPTTPFPLPKLNSQKPPGSGPSTPTKPPLVSSCSTTMQQNQNTSSGDS
jgi:hypothetical protein